MSRIVRIQSLLAVALCALSALTQRGGDTVSVFPDGFSLFAGTFLVVLAVGRAYPELPGLASWRRGLRVTWVPALAVGVTQVILIGVHLNLTAALGAWGFLAGAGLILLIGQLGALGLQLWNRWQDGRAGS